MDFEVLVFLRAVLPLLVFFRLFRHRKVEVLVGGQYVVFGFEYFELDQRGVDFEEKLFESAHDGFVVSGLETLEGVEVFDHDRDEYVVDPVPVQHLQSQIREPFELPGLSFGVVCFFRAAFRHPQDAGGLLEVFELLLRGDHIRHGLERVS